MKILTSKENNIFFTSDTHAYHKNIVKGVSDWTELSRCRDFNTIEEMTFKLIENINEIVKKDDILFHLGDWSFGGIENIWKFRKQINCKNIHLILGNHDQHIENNRTLPNCLYEGDSGVIIDGIYSNSINIFENVNAEELFSSVSHYKEISIDKNLFILSHYAMRIWNKSHHNSIHLYGHSHGTLEDNYGLSMDVGVDTNNLKPYSYSEILDIMKIKESLIIDHHNENTN